ncbi:hypothetical protein [Macrococcus carouselicus]|uniref:Uncharacterized protein n=1 Tax=Macrococcus carouselicus TaxID=69969 RepID=A0A9Q8CCZ5_9STAP|nr:hypothetical protein [Macrococcus carouselicus]TDL95541.1 hypothetical protein ERX40_10180 [Macrococcus carouselicus]
MKTNDKIFILALNIAWMFFLHYLVRSNIELFQEWRPLIVPIILTVVLIIMLYFKINKDTKDKPVR